MAASYGLPLDRALWEFPVEACQALFPAMAKRLGWEIQGPDSVEAAMAKANAKMKKHLQANYEILPPRRLRKRKGAGKEGA